MKHRYSGLLPSFTLVCDIILLNAAYFLTHGIQFQESPRLMMIKTLCWVLLSPLFNIYKTPRPLLLRENMYKFLEVLGCHLVVIFGLVLFSKNFGLLNYALFGTYAVFILLVGSHRYLLSLFLDYIRKQGYNARKITIIGDDDIAFRLESHFLSRPAYGYEIISNSFAQDFIQDLDQNFAQKILEQDVHEIFFCYKKAIPELIGFLTAFGAQHKIKIKLVSELVMTGSSSRIINYDTLPVLHLRNESELSRTERTAKRGFDILFSATLIVVGSPLLATLYLITKITSKGPAWYTQERIGLNGKPFQIIKFRSMYTDAEQMGPQLSKHGDPRITAWGKLIRKTRLDELPQFFNVLKGEMSVVGPRPERQHFIDQISKQSPHYKLLQNIRPGITSIGQIKYGYAENVEQMCERMEYDLLYLQDISFGSDISLILNTVKVMVQGKGK